MKRIVWIILAANLGAMPAGAALRFGLGDAVAKRSAELINRASGSAVGDSVAATLPACPAGAIYDSSPTDVAMIAAFDPLGHVAPSGHVFPSDHIYPYANGLGVTPPVYAPGTIHVTQITARENQTAGYTDYSIYFYACRNVKSYFHHVRTLSASFAAQMPPVTSNCSTYTSGGTTYRDCIAYTNFVLQSGDLIGYATTGSAFDIGTYDFRITPLSFVSPARKYPEKLYTVCPIDYFTPGPKAAMEAKLGRYDGGFMRVTAPICGRVDFDVAGTAKGDWYLPGAPDIPEDPHLALIDDNVYAPQQRISYGTSLPNAATNSYMFAAAGAGLVNRDFSQVTADNNIYCYDNLLLPNNAPWVGSPIFLIQITSATTLRFELQNAANCGAGPWAFTVNAGDFQR